MMTFTKTHTCLMLTAAHVHTCPLLATPQMRAARFMHLPRYVTRAVTACRSALTEPMSMPALRRSPLNRTLWVLGGRVGARLGLAPLLSPGAVSVLLAAAVVVPAPGLVLPGSTGTLMAMVSPTSCSSSSGAQSASRHLGVEGARPTDK
jgi:hypothetical protein